MRAVVLPTPGVVGVVDVDRPPVVEPTDAVPVTRLEPVDGDSCATAQRTGTSGP